MPSLIIIGHPAAGKTKDHSGPSFERTSRALQHPAIQDIVIINEESACPDWTKQECYSHDIPCRKKRLGRLLSLRSTLPWQHHNKQTLVILDSLNYIKGFRYELPCISKAVGECHGILWVLNRASVVEEWNFNRIQQERQGYSREVLLE